MSHITASTDENVLVIKIEPASLNDFDLWSVVGKEVDQAFQRFNTRNAVIDLQNLTTLNSLGLGFFVRLLKKAQRRSGRVILCNATGVVEDVLNSLFSDCAPDLCGPGAWGPVALMGWFSGSEAPEYGRYWFDYSSW